MVAAWWWSIRLSRLRANCVRCCRPCTDYSPSKGQRTGRWNGWPARPLDRNPPNPQSVVHRFKEAAMTRFAKSALAALISLCTPLAAPLGVMQAVHAADLPGAYSDDD